MSSKNKRSSAQKGAKEAQNLQQTETENQKASFTRTLNALNLVAALGKACLQSPETCLQMGNYYYNLSDYLTAIQTYTQALTFKLTTKDKITCYSQRGYSYLTQDDYDSALKDFSEARLIGSQDLDLEINIATCHYKLNKIDLALNKFLALYKKKELCSVAGAVAICINLARIYFEKKDFTKSIKYYLEAEAKDEKLFCESNHYLNVALALEHNHQFNKAINYLRKAISLAEKKNDKITVSDLYNKIGICYLELNKFTEAKKAFEKALSLDSNNEAARDNLDKYLAPSPEEAIKQKDNNAFIYYTAGLELVSQEPHQELYKAAIECFQQAIQYGAFAHRDIALVYERLNNFPMALEYYDASIRVLEDRDIPINAAYYYERGNIQLKRMKPRAAKQDFETAKNRLMPEDSISREDIEQKLKETLIPPNIASSLRKNSHLHRSNSATNLVVTETPSNIQRPRSNSL